jgi:hypothetical protein
MFDLCVEYCQLGFGILFLPASLQVQSRPTQRAADKWDSARFLSFWLASGLSCSQAESTLRPLAANASRWAQEANTTNSLEGQ